MPGAFHATRGMLEFWIDPASPYHKPVFAQDKKFVFFCAGGWRSALAAQTAQRMGLKPVAHIKGGFGDWKKSGAPVEMPEPKQEPDPFARLIRRITYISLDSARCTRGHAHLEERCAIRWPETHHRQQELFVVVVPALDRA